MLCVYVSSLASRAVWWRVLLLLILTLPAPGALAASASGVELMPGVTYTRQIEQVRGSQVVFHVVTVPKPGGLYRLVPVLSNGTITGTETVSHMEERLAGSATAVGVNGDLFNWEVGYPSGMFMRDGTLVGRPSGGRSSLGIGADGLLRLARVAFYGTWAIGGQTAAVLSQFNRPLDGAGVGLFTSAWGTATPKKAGAVEVVVSGLSTTAPNTDLTAQVVETRRGGATPIPAGGAVLQAVGPLGRQLSAVAEPGAPLVVRLILKPWWDGVADAIGGGPALIKDGRVALPTTESFTSDQVLPRHPRTAVGQLGDGRIVLVAVDGRQSFSIGVNLWDLARKLKKLGAVNAMAFDAGGSTTLAFDGKVLNSPSDGHERAVSTSLMMLYYGAYAPAPLNDTVSPNGDGVAEGQRLAYRIVRPSTVSARLLGPGGNVLWEDEGQKQPGTYPFVPDQSMLAEGRYRWVVSAVDENGEGSEAERTYSVNNTLGFLRLSRTKLTVTAKKAGQVLVSFRLARQAKITVAVEDRFGRVLRRLANALPIPSGPVALVWNARVAGGQIVAGGSYSIHVHAQNAIGAADLTRTVSVKRSAARGG